MGSGPVFIVPNPPAKGKGEAPVSLPVERGRRDFSRRPLGVGSVGTLCLCPGEVFLQLPQKGFALLGHLLQGAGLEGGA